jgi:hypothetical protein
MTSGPTNSTRVNSSSPLLRLIFSSLELAFAENHGRARENDGASDKRQRVARLAPSRPRGSQKPRQSAHDRGDAGWKPIVIASNATQEKNDAATSARRTLQRNGIVSG